jgi:hypothetical protein
MNNDSQRTPLNPQLYRCLADIFAVGINVERMLGLNPHPAGLKVLDFRDVQMVAAIN